MQKSKTFLYDDLVMSNEELAKVVSDEMAKNDPEAIMDMMLSIGKESEEIEPGVLKEAAPIAQMVFIAQGMYKYGFMMATYYMNEALKASFEEEKGGAV